MVNNRIGLEVNTRIALKMEPTATPVSKVFFLPILPHIMPAGKAASPAANPPKRSI